MRNVPVRNKAKMLRFRRFRLLMGTNMYDFMQPKNGLSLSWRASHAARTPGRGGANIGRSFEGTVGKPVAVAKVRGMVKRRVRVGQRRQLRPGHRSQAIRYSLSYSDFQLEFTASRRTLRA